MEKPEQAQVPLPNGAGTKPPRGPWLEYALAVLVYILLAAWLHSLNRPGLFWISVIFAIACAAGAVYLYRRPQGPTGR